jgi:outer membrane usher protein
VVNIGSEAHFRVARFGQADVRLSASSADAQTGYAASANYQYFSSQFHANLSFRTLSKAYANVSLAPGADKPRYEWLLGLGFNSWQWGSLTASYSERVFHGGARSDLATLSWSRLLGDFGTLVTRYRKVGGDREDREVFVGINRPFGFGRLASMEYRSNQLTSMLSARISRSRSISPGWGYDLNLGWQEGDPNALLYAEYGGAHGVYSASYRRARGGNAFRMGTAGAVSWTGGNINFSRPIRDSFALVEVEDLAGVEVMLNNQFIGKTNQDGLLLVPGLNPYYGNRLSISDKGIPVNFELPRLDQIIATPFRGGGLVTFEAQKLQSFSGVLNVIENGESRPAEYWGLRYAVEGEAIETVVGKAGMFYFENTPAGPLPVEIFLADSVCRLVLDIPDTPDMHVDLGESNCEMSN